MMELKRPSTVRHRSIGVATVVVVTLRVTNPHAEREGYHGARLRRRGAVLVMVLVVLGVALALCGAVLRAALAERGLVERQVWQAQAEWLARAALDRAAARLEADPAYSGETWSAPPAELGGRHTGRVVISIVAAPDSAGRSIEIRAEYPSNLDLPAHATRRALLPAILDSE